MEVIKITLLIIIVGLFAYLYNNYNRCDLPIKYSIGAVDRRFQLPSEKVEIIAKNAAEKWNLAAGISVLEYNPSSTMAINLVYDQRQASLDQLRQNVDSLKSQNLTLEDWKKELEKLMADYESSKRAYEDKVDRYNRDVEHWNARGGASEVIRNQLDAEKIQLSQEYDELESKRQEINQLVKLLNSEADDYNSDLDTLKNSIDNDKNKIITQGLYYVRENKIDIFTFGNEKELQLVLMHELGHAMGLGHTEGSDTVMNSILGGQDINNPILKTEDINALITTCRTNKGMINLPLLNPLFNSLRNLNFQ